MLIYLIEDKIIQKRRHLTLVTVENALEYANIVIDLFRHRFVQVLF